MQRITPAVSHTLVTCVTHVTVSLNLSVTLPSLVPLVQTGPDWKKKAKKRMVSPGASGVLARPGPSVQRLGKSAGAVATMPFEKVDTMLTGLLLAEKLKSYQAPDRTSGWPDGSQLAEEVI